MDEIEVRDEVEERDTPEDNEGIGNAESVAVEEGKRDECRSDRHEEV